MGIALRTAALTAVVFGGATLAASCGSSASPQAFADGGACTDDLAPCSLSTDCCPGEACIFEGECFADCQATCMPCTDLGKTCASALDCCTGVCENGACASACIGEGEPCGTGDVCCNVNMAQHSCMGVRAWCAEASGWHAETTRAAPG